MSPAPRPGPGGPEPGDLDRVVEAIVFAHDGPVTIDSLAAALPGVEPAALRAAFARLGRQYDADGRSFELTRIAGGYQIVTRERWAAWVARFERGSRRVRLSRAAVETLSIIAYRQPITRTQMEEIRGVDSGAVLHTLLERDLITVKGRGRGVGRPLLYVTTPEFLRTFGLDTLADLPRLDEVESIIREREEPVDDGAGGEPEEDGGPGAESPAEGAPGGGELESANAATAAAPVEVGSRGGS